MNVHLTCTVIWPPSLAIEPIVNVVESRRSSWNLKKTLLVQNLDACLSISDLPHNGGFVISPLAASRYPFSILVSIMYSYWVRNCNTESYGCTIFLNNAFILLDLPVVLVKGKKHFLKYAGTHIDLVEDMFQKSLLPCISYFTSMLCHNISNSSGDSVKLVQQSNSSTKSRLFLINQPNFSQGLLTT